MRTLIRIVVFPIGIAGFIVAGIVKGFSLVAHEASVGIVYLADAVLSLGE